VSTIEHLTAADHAAVGCLLLGAYADYAERLGPDAWARMSEGLVQATGRLSDAEIVGVRAPPGRDAAVFYFPPGRSSGKIFPREWASLRLLGVAQIGLHTSEAMTTARGLYERVGFVVDSDLPKNSGLRYWRFRRSLEGG
jgi:hypothetical protein